MTGDNRDLFALGGKQPDAGDDPQQQPPDPILALIAEGSAAAGDRLQVPRASR